VKGVEKTTDIRPLITSLILSDAVLVMRLSAAQDTTLRPDVMIAELKRRAGDFECSIKRSGLFTFENSLPQPLLDAFAV